MYLSKEYFDQWMQQLTERLERIEQLYARIQVQEYKQLSDGSKLLDNFDLCQLLNVSKRTLQRYRTSGELPYEMLYHKTYYKETEVQAFIKRNFDRFRNIKRKKK